MLAAQLVEPLRLQIARRKALHDADLLEGKGEVWLHSRHMSRHASR